MHRTLVGAGIGSVCGLLTVAGLGAWEGFMHGAEWMADPTLPPAKAAILWALRAVAYWWLVAVGVGGFIGALAGFVSWLVRPRRAARG